MTTTLQNLLPVLFALALAALVLWQLERTHRKAACPLSRHHHGLPLWTSDAQERRRAIR